LNDELLFKIVECDLVVAEVGDRRISKYSIVVSPIFMDIIVYVDTLTGTAYLSYNHTLPFIPTTMTTIPPINATWMTSVFTKSLRNLNPKEYLANVPLTIDHSLFFTVGVGINPYVTCSNGSRDAAAINNVTFDMPTTTILEAHYWVPFGSSQNMAVQVEDRKGPNKSVEPPPSDLP
ncbi:hypothetical protein Goarm_009857, partial [Gossypium armourianum]|nr:hypothetical protein [Gossypium armourianum]